LKPVSLTFVTKLGSIHSYFSYKKWDMAPDSRTQSHTPKAKGA